MHALEATDYDRFSFDEANQQNALTLDEAVRKAKEMRKGDSGNFYRIEVVDENQLTFKVTPVPVESVYSEFMSRMSQLIGRYKRQNRHK